MGNRDWRRSGLNFEALFLRKKDLENRLFNDKDGLVFKRSEKTGLASFQCSMRIELGSSWHVYDMVNFLSVVESLYNFIALFELVKFCFKRLQRDHNILALFYDYIYTVYMLNHSPIPFHPIAIKSIRMASPGNIEINGAGILKELRELIKDVSYRNDLEAKMLKISYVERLVALSKEIGLSSSEVQSITREVLGLLPRVEKLYGRGMIYDAKIIDKSV